MTMELNDMSVEELEAARSSLAFEDVEGTGIYLDHSGNRAVTLGCRPFLCSPYEIEEGKDTAFKHIVAARVRYLTTWGDGTEELFSEFDSTKFGIYVSDFIRAAQTPGPQEKARVACLFAEAILFEAQRQAHDYALRHIDEIWQNRRNPDYLPPWEGGA